MDRDRIEGRRRQVGGMLREWWGRLTRPPVDRIPGRMERRAGRVQAGYGRLRDNVRMSPRRGAL
jgi:uncharacterized protein YjbJ (UPF0337 family)